MEFLSSALDAPSWQAVARAMSILHEVGACVTDMVDGHSRPVLTALGHHLARLPVSVRLGKMLVYAAAFGCQEPAVSTSLSLSIIIPRTGSASVMRPRFIRWFWQFIYCFLNFYFLKNRPVPFPFKRQSNPAFCVYVAVYFVNCACLLLLVFQEIGWEKRLWNDLFCVTRDVKVYVNQSISFDWVCCFVFDALTLLIWRYDIRRSNNTSAVAKSFTPWTFERFC